MAELTRVSFRSSVRWVLVLLIIKLALHVATNWLEPRLGYGYFRDELYFLVCGRRLDWGYVDQGPLVAIQARLAEWLLGSSLPAIRLPAALAGCARMVLAAMLCQSFGGKLAAQLLAVVCVLMAPQFLGLDSFLSMNSFESLFWLTALMALIWRTQQSIHTIACALIVGVAVGLGVLNKPSILLFVTAIAVGVACSPHRRLLISRETALAAAVATLIASPFVLWQWHHGWPMLELLNNQRAEGKNQVLSALEFMAEQIKGMNPVAIVVWVPGLWFLLRRREVRWIGLAWLIFEVLGFYLHAKPYYVSPPYPALFAAGAAFWEEYFNRRLATPKRRSWAMTALAAPIVLVGILILPLAIPVFTPSGWQHYMDVTHLQGQSRNTEVASSGGLPQFYADRFGWPEETAEVARIYASLSPQDRADAVVIASNYGEASALLVLSTSNERPEVISTHNNYWIWGPKGASGKVVIAITGQSLDELRGRYASCAIAGRLQDPWSMPYERRNIYLCRNRNRSFVEDWNSLKHFI